MTEQGRPAPDSAGELTALPQISVRSSIPAMGGLGGPPIDQNLGLVAAARNSLPQTRGKFSLVNLTFGHFFVRKWTKSFQLEGPLAPYQGLCPWTPLGALLPDPRLGSRSAISPCSDPLWQILDPTLPQIPQLVQGPLHGGEGSGCG